MIKVSAAPITDPDFEPRLGRSLSIDQAATILRLSSRTVYNRIREGRLQTIRTIGGSQRVLVSSLYEDLGFPSTGISVIGIRSVVRPSSLHPVLTATDYP